MSKGMGEDKTRRPQQFMSWRSLWQRPKQAQQQTEGIEGDGSGANDEDETEPRKRQSAASAAPTEDATVTEPAQSDGTSTTEVMDNSCDGIAESTNASLPPRTATMDQGFTEDDLVRHITVDDQDTQYTSSIASTETETATIATARMTATKRRSSTFVQNLRNKAGSTIIAANFVSSCWSSAWTERDKWRDWLAPLDALYEFLKSTGIDQEVLSQISTFRDRSIFWTNCRILAHCHKVIAPSLQHRIDTVRSKPVDQPPQYLRQPKRLYRFMQYATAVYGKSVIQAAKLETGQSATLWHAAKTEIDAIAQHVGLLVDDIVVLHDPWQNRKKLSTANKFAANNDALDIAEGNEGDIDKTSSQTIDSSESDHANTEHQDHGDLQVLPTAIETTTQDDRVPTKDAQRDFTLTHFVALDHDEEAVVLCIRGTYSLQELLVDLGAFTKPFCYGEGHAEIISIIQILWKESGDKIVDQLTRHPDYDLILTGHSLGGSSAALLNLWLQSTLLESDVRDSDDLAIPELLPPLPKHITSSRIRCYSFGGLPVYAASNRKHYEHSGKGTQTKDGTETDNDENDSTWTAQDEYHSRMAPILKQSSTNVMHRYDYAPFASIHSVRRLLQETQAVRDYYYTHLAEQQQDDDKKVHWRFRTQRWWQRQQVGWQSTTPPQELIEFVQNASLVTPKDGAPSLYVPTGCVLWIGGDEPAHLQQDAEEFDLMDVEMDFARVDRRDAPEHSVVNICDPIQVTSRLGFVLHDQMLLDHLPSRYERVLHHMKQ